MAGRRARGRPSCSRAVRWRWPARCCCSTESCHLCMPKAPIGAFFFCAGPVTDEALPHEVLMITEIAQIDVKPGSEKDFEAAVARARAAFGRSKGFHGFELHRSIEKPQR